MARAAAVGGKPRRLARLRGPDRGVGRIIINPASSIGGRISVDGVVADRGTGIQALNPAAPAGRISADGVVTDRGTGITARNPAAVLRICISADNVVADRGTGIDATNPAGALVR